MRKYVDYLIVTGTMHENIAITTVIVIPILFEVCNYYSYKFYFSIKKNLTSKYAMVMILNIIKTLFFT